MCKPESEHRLLHLNTLDISAHPKRSSKAKRTIEIIETEWSSLFVAYKVTHAERRAAHLSHPGWAEFESACRRGNLCEAPEEVDAWLQVWGGSR